MWITVDGSPVHVSCREPLTAEETEALVAVIRAAREEIDKRPPEPYAAEAERLRARLDELGLSLAEAWRRWPQWGLGAWSRMLAGKDDPRPAIESIEGSERV